LFFQTSFGTACPRRTTRKWNAYARHSFPAHIVNVNNSCATRCSWSHRKY
jgi:hypothetical protein